jgi:amylovoran biosynthesis glycosyltransferase AmsD
VAFDCDFGPGEVIINGTTGFLVPYSDDAIFMERLTYLMEHPEVRELMGIAAKKASNKYKPDEIMSQWLKLFQS